MATEREFNLSCPALSLSLPISETDRPSKSDTSSAPVSTTLAPTTIASVETTKPTESHTTSTSSTVPKLYPTRLPYHVPDHPYFKPVSPNYPFQFFHPNVPPTVAPLSTKAVVTPSPVTQGLKKPVYPQPYDQRPPQRWYPWYPKPNLVPAPYPTQSLPITPPREPLLPLTKAPKPSRSPLVYVLKPTSIPLQDKTTRRKPLVQWAPVYPPRKLSYPFYPGKPGFINTTSVAFAQLQPGKPGFVDATSVAFGQVPQWLYPSHARPIPHEPPRLKPSEQQALLKPVLAPPTPAPTKKVKPPQLLHNPWYKPFPQQRLETPSVPTKVPYVTAFAPQIFKRPDYSDIKGPPISMHFDFTTSTPLTHLNFSHSLSLHCPTFCPGPPSLSYHHHNHHHFGHPFPVPYLGTASLAKFTAEIQSSPVQLPGSALFPFIQSVGYNYSPYSSKVEALPPATQYVAPTVSPVIKPTRAPESEPLIRPTLCPYIFRTLTSNLGSSQSTMKPAIVPPFVHSWEPTKPLFRPSQNAPIAESVAHSVQSPMPALYQAEMQHYISQWRQHRPAFVAPNNAGPFSQSQYDVSLKPTTSPANNNYWYQAASYPGPPMSDAPAEISKKATVNNDRNSLQSTTPSRPQQAHDVDPPIQLNVHPSMQIRKSVPVHTQLYDSQNGEPSVPIFRDPEPFGSYWVPAVQSNQKTVHSTHYPDGKLAHCLLVL